MLVSEGGSPLNVGLFDKSIVISFSQKIENMQQTPLKETTQKLRGQMGPSRYDISEFVLLGTPSDPLQLDSDKLIYC